MPGGKNYPEGKVIPSLSASQTGPLRIEKLSKEELVPGVLEAGEAPVDAVRVADRVGELLGGEWAPLLLVD